MSTKSKQDKKKFWIRVICAVLAVIMVGTTLLAAFGVF